MSHAGILHRTHGHIHTSIHACLPCSIPAAALTTLLLDLLSATSPTHSHTHTYMALPANLQELSKASGVPLEDIPIMVPDAETNRPAYAVAIDHSHKTVVWGFRGTTDLEVGQGEG